MASFGNGKAGGQLKSAINKDHPKPIAPQAPPVGARAGSDGIYIGDFDLTKVSFGELRKGTSDSFFPFLYDGQEMLLKLRLCKNPSDWIRQPFEAGPYVERNKDSSRYGEVIDAKWTSRVDLSNPIVREKLLGLERLAIDHMLANQDDPAFSKLGVPLKKTIMDPATGDDMQGLGGAVPKYNSNVAYAKDLEKRAQFAPTYKIRVPHEPNAKGGGMPLIQLCALFEEQNTISKRQTGTIQDLQKNKLAYCPTIRLLRGIYGGNLGVGMSFLLDDCLIITNKSGQDEKETDIGDFKEMDETEEEINAKMASGDYNGSEPFQNGAVDSPAKSESASD